MSDASVSAGGAPSESRSLNRPLESCANSSLGSSAPCCCRHSSATSTTQLALSISSSSCLKRNSASACRRDQPSNHRKVYVENPRNIAAKNSCLSETVATRHQVVSALDTDVASSPNATYVIHAVAVTT